MTKTTLQFSPIGRRIFSLATGFNFRIRDNDGEFYSIKPSTRPRAVKGEYGFETFNPNKNDVQIGVDIPAGEYSLEPLKHGWLKLVPATGDRPPMLTSVQEAMQEAMQEEIVPVVEPELATEEEEIQEAIEVAETATEVQEETPRERRNRLRREKRRAEKEQKEVAEAA